MRKCVLSLCLVFALCLTLLPILVLAGEIAGTVNDAEIVKMEIAKISSPLNETVAPESVASLLGTEDDVIQRISLDVDKWSKAYDWKNISVFSKENDTLVIANPEENAAMYSTTVPVKPQTNYCIHAMTRIEGYTQGVENSGGATVGYGEIFDGNTCFFNDYVTSSAWTRSAVYFNSGDNTEMSLRLANGGHGCVTVGTAYFREIYLDELVADNRWDVLTLIYKNVDTGTFQNSFSIQDTATLREIVGNLPDTFHRLSNGRMEIGQLDIVEVEEPIRSISGEYWGDLTHGEGGDINFNSYLDGHNYNQVVVFAPILNAPSTKGWLGLGGTFFYYRNQQIYYCIINDLLRHNPSHGEVYGEAYDIRTSAVVHEMLHCVETNSRQRGWDGFVEVHSAEENGYTSGDTEWLDWYHDLMQDTVKSGKPGFHRESFLVPHKVSNYYLDLNAYLDGTLSYGLGDYGTVDVYINGSLVADDTSDYYAEWPSGTSYEIRDIKPKVGYSYSGIQSGSRVGTITDDNVSVYPNFTKVDTSAITEYPESHLYNGHTYLLITTPATWYSAKLVCEARGGHLATITTEEENNIIQSLCGNRQAWIGGNDTDSEGNWHWVSGETFAYANWSDSQPDNYAYNDEGCENYLQLYENGTWNDNAGYALFPFVCEIDSAEITVTFDANGGNASFLSKTVMVGNIYGALPTATRSGYTFDGWYTLFSGGTKITESSTVPTTTGQTLYAHWTKSVDFNTLQIAVENRRALKGTIVDIPVAIKNNPGISGAALTVSYDKSVLTLNSVQKGSVFATGTYSADTSTGVVIWYHTENVTDNGTLLTLQFAVNSNAGVGRYPVTVGLREGKATNLTNANSASVSAEFLSGALEVMSGVRGDVTGDGDVAINDVVKVARAVARKITLTESERALADVTGDGFIAINDVVKLARYVAGSIASLQSVETAALADGASAVIEAATVNGKPGEIIRVPVSITSNLGIAGAQLDILFDNGLTLKNIIQGDVMSEGTFEPDVSARMIQWYYDQANVTSAGVLFTLEFEVSAEAKNGDAYAIMLNVTDGISANLSDYDSNPVNAEFKPGKIQISETADNTAITTVSRNGNTITANVVCADSNASVFCAVYNNSGKMIAVRSVQITGESNYQFQFDGQQFDYAKAFIVDGNFRPLCESKKS